MKFSCTKENLSRALALVNGVTGKNINLPILGNVLLKADEQKLTVIATNLELAMVVTVRAKVETAGSFTVPARTLADYVTLLPNEKIDFSLEGTELKVDCGRSSTKIKGTTAEDFPIIPTMEDGVGYTIDAAQLKNAFSQVLPAVAKNDIRPELAGVCAAFNYEGQPGLTLAATDSYRLAEKHLTIKQGNDEKRIIIPGRTAQEIQHLLTSPASDNSETEARIQVNDNQIMVRFSAGEVVSRLVEGSYPDYRQIVPKEFTTTVSIETGKLVKEMKASGLFTTTGVNAVSLVIKPAEGVVAVASTSSQTGEYASEIPAEVAGTETTILLNNRYVLDGLANFSTEQSEIKVINSDSPCIFTPAGDTSYLYIVMPNPWRCASRTFAVFQARA